MSWPALGWASKQKPGRVADKMVLIALADRHNEESNVAYPSIAWLADFACLDRKTVVAALDRLEAAGLISDSGMRTGKTRQVKAYHLAINSPEKGDPKTVPLAVKDTAFSVKQSQKRDTEPVLEPIVPNGTIKSSDDDTLSPDDVIEGWNAVANDCGLPVVRKLTEQRKRKLRTRIKQFPDIEDWRRALTEIRENRWMHGDNDRGWRADFDFLLQDKSFTKLTEGAYGKAG